LVEDSPAKAGVILDNPRASHEEIPSTKYQIPNKPQAPNKKISRFWILKIGAYLEFEN